jgi:hypothetical protein
MSFRYQHRVNLGHGKGLNLSKSGVSGILRTTCGSIGRKGFSNRTGIPGLSYRKYGKSNKSNNGWLLPLLIFVLAALIIWKILRLVVWLAAYTMEQLKNHLKRRATFVYTAINEIVQIGFNPLALNSLTKGATLQAGDWLVAADSQVAVGQPVLLLWDNEGAYAVEAEHTPRLIPLLQPELCLGQGDLFNKIHAS